MSRSYCAMMLAWGVACSLISFSIGKAKADIAWQGPQNIAGDSDVSTLGVLVKAWGAGGGVNGANVNGVTFTDADSGILLALSGDVGFGGNSSIYNPLSANYKRLLDSAVFNASGFGLPGPNPLIPIPGSMGITLNNLNVGRLYEFQAFVNDSRNFGVNHGRFNIFDSGAGSIQSLPVFQPLSDNDASIGQHIKGTFIATSNTQLVRIFGDALTTPKTSLLNAYQVRDITAVPEPSSILLLSSVAGLGGMFLRKRHGKKVEGVSSLPS